MLDVAAEDHCQQLWWMFLGHINVSTSLQSLKNNYNSVNVKKVLLGTWPQCLV